MSKILITGVAGSIGFNLAKKLLSDGEHVIGIDNFISGDKEKIVFLKNKYRKQFKFIKFDINKKSLKLILLLQKIKEIYHLASPASPKAYQENPWDTILSNTIGTKNMLELAKNKKSKFLFTSTSEVYGEAEVHPQPETYTGNVTTWGPRACYDESKRLGETICYEYYDKYKMKIKVARLFNTYSEDLRSNDGRVISNFINQALLNQDITIYGNGLQTRSFCYVEDTIRALILMMKIEGSCGTIINIGNPEEYSILYLANKIKELTKSNSNFIFKNLPKNDPLTRKPNINKAKFVLDWKPEISLEEGLLKTIEGYKKNIDKVSF